jgi:hypothetical protein
MPEPGRVRRLLPRPLVRALKKLGAGTSYLIVRPETDRIADQLNDSVVESFAYVQHRLAEIDARLQRLEGAPREQVMLVVEAAGLAAAAAEARAGVGAGATLFACVLHRDGSEVELRGWRVRESHRDAEHDLLLLTAEAV